ncbi:MAG: hypothetical protein QG580_410 [Patescibacteria group bacterium]|nr:hypothetical protein [Patescibacteria group bacterium]
MVVDYSMTFTQMTAAGKYIWSDIYINSKQFPLTGTGKVAFEPKLFHFDRNISYENAIKEMDKDGFRPAKIEELLAYGTILLPERDLKHPIIALGSVIKVNGLPCAAYIQLCGFSSRGILLRQIKDDLHANNLCLGVRK